MLGDPAVRDETMDRICAKVQAARDGIAELAHPAAELTLQRCCLNVSKASYALRCCGDAIGGDRLRRFDECMASGLESALWCPLPDDRWTQATLAIDAGGIGMREASEWYVSH